MDNVYFSIQEFIDLQDTLNYFDKFTIKDDYIILKKVVNTSIVRIEVSFIPIQNDLAIYVENKCIYQTNDFNPLNIESFVNDILADSFRMSLRQFGQV